MKSTVISFVMIAVLACPVATQAHHSFAGTYDGDKIVRIEGRLISFAFRSPHSVVSVDVADENGKTQRWTVEWGAARQLANQGITREFFKPGDLVIITGNPGRNRAAFIMVMRSMIRPSDGFEWGNRPDEVVR
jgi:hypothetical protein